MKKLVTLLVIAVMAAALPQIGVSADDEFSVECVIGQGVESGKPDSALTGVKGILCKNTGRIGYLKFDLSAIRDAVTDDTILDSVTLQLTVIGSNLDGTPTTKASKNQIYYVEDDTWNNSLTFNTKPSWSEEMMAEEVYVAEGTANASIFFEITDAVKNELNKQGDQYLSIALFSNGNGGTYFGGSATTLSEKRPVLHVKIKEKEKTDAIGQVQIESGSLHSGGEIAVALDICGWDETKTTPAVFGGLYQVEEQGETMLNIQLQNEKQVSLTETETVRFVFDVPTDDGQYELRFWVTECADSGVLHSSEVVICGDEITKRYPQARRNFQYHSDVSVDMDRETGLITLSGSAVQPDDKEIVKPMCLFVLPEGIACDQLNHENIGTAAAYVGILYFDDTNQFEKNFYNPADVAKQSYCAYVIAEDSAEGMLSLPLDYYLSGVQETAFRKLTQQTESEAYIKYAVANSSLLGVNEVYATDASEIYSYLFDLQLTDHDMFVQKFNQCAAVQGIKAADGQEILQVLDAYLSDFQMEDDIKAAYHSAAYTETAKVRLTEQLKSGGMDFANVSDVVREQMILSALTSAVKYGDLKDAMANETLFGQYFKTVFAADEYFGKLENQSDFYKLLFRDIKTCKTLGAVEQLVHAAAKTVYDAAKSETAQQTGKSTGGGGRSSNVSFVKPESSPALQPENPEKTPPEVLRAEAFSDLASVPWAAESIETLYRRQIVSGDGTGSFHPQDYTAKEAFVKIIVGAFGYKASGETVRFQDVELSHWAYPYIALACQNGLIYGTNEQSFGLGTFITRQDAATVIYRAIKQSGINMEEQLYFDDADSISPYAREAVAYLAGAGIVSGMGDNTFAPERYTTRAEICKLVCAALNWMGSDLE